MQSCLRSARFAIQSSHCSFVPKAATTRLSSTSVSARRMYTTGNAEVLFEEQNNKVMVTLNRPKALNSLNINMIRLMTPKYEAIRRDRSAQMIVMRGAGEKAFCAGGDIRAIYDAKVAPSTAGADPAIKSLFFKEEYHLNQLIGSLKSAGVAHVALIDGITMGGGVGLSVHGAFRVATERTIFAMPETGIGFFCDVGGSYFLPRLKGNLGMFLALSGAQLKGKAVCDAGIATHFVPSESLPKLQEKLLALPLDANDAEGNFAQISKTIAEFMPADASQPDETLQAYMALADKYFGERRVEDIMDKLSKDDSPAAKDILKKIQRASPTSLKVVQRQIQEGGRLGFNECFDMEYRLSQVFMQNNDFFEGVRALLVDKDKNPKWNPASIQEVTDDLVASYFQ